jgi:hypothetical protein
MNGVPEEFAEVDGRMEVWASDGPADGASLNRMGERSDGDMLFERYLAQRGIPIPEHEPDLAEFADGSMRPKIEAACRFASQTGKIAAIGALADAPAILAGQAGTHIISDSAESPTAASESALGRLGERAAELDEDIRTASLLRDHPATAHSADPCSDSPSHRRR